MNYKTELVLRCITLRNLSYVLLSIGVILGLWYLFFGNYFVGDWHEPDANKARAIQPFITGLVAPLLTLGSTLLLVENLRSSNRNNFSNIFFKLVDQHHKLVDNIQTTIGGDDVKGRAFFDDLCALIAKDFNSLSNLESIHKPHDDLSSQAKGKDGKELLVSIYDYYFQIHQSDLGHYFRNLYHIVRYVDETPFQKKFKDNHVRHLRAQMSNYEILLLVYNGLHEYGDEFYPLIEKYRLHKSLNIEDKLPSGYEKRIVDVVMLRKCYPEFDSWLTECGK